MAALQERDDPSIDEGWEIAIQVERVPVPIDFNNTGIAFRSQTDEELRMSYYLLKALGYNTVVNLGPLLVHWAFKWRLPVRRSIKRSVFRTFCGGETFEDCLDTVRKLYDAGIRTMLDYAVEGGATEEALRRAAEEVASATRKAKDVPAIRCTVVKPTGLARPALLEKLSDGVPLSQGEQAEWKRAVGQLEGLCRTAADAATSVFVDAEESWMQKAIDELTLEMMAKVNRERPVLYTTVQMYRRGRLEFLEQIRGDARKRSYRAGIKLVRGAYLETEQEWAAKRGREPGVYTDKADTDHDFDDALRYIVEHLDYFALCAATHNETSTGLLLELMEEKGLDPADARIELSQLYGMGNHLTYNLAHHGYNASKYVPYGPVELVLPYLARRAQENSSVQGTAGRELRLLTEEMRRRGLIR